MFPRYIHLFLLALSVFSFPAYGCELSLKELDDIYIDTSLVPGYNQRSDAGQTVSDVFRVVGTGGGCSFFVSFSGNSPVRYLKSNNGQQISYQLYDSIQHHNALYGLPTIKNNVLNGILNNGQPTRTLRYYFYFSNDQNISAGTYQDTVTVSVYEGDQNTFTLRDSRTVTYTVVIPPVIDILINTTGSDSRSATLDFGILQPGKTLPFEVVVTGNVAYDMNIQSENKGLLKHSTATVNNTIPYTLFKSGSLINLSKTTQLSFPRRGASLQKKSYDFSAAIDDYDFVLSGKYQDFILFTVVAR